MSASDSKDKHAPDEDVKVKSKVQLQLGWNLALQQTQRLLSDHAVAANRSSSRRKSDKIKMLLKENAALKRQIDNLKRSSAKEKVPEEDADDPLPVSDSDAARIYAVLNTIKALCDVARKMNPTGELTVSYGHIFECYKGDQLAVLKRVLKRKTVIAVLLCQYGIKAEPDASDKFGLVLK